MRVLTHINQRVKSVPEIKLPTEKILALYLSPAAENPFLKNFSLVYLDMAFERCTPQVNCFCNVLIFEGESSVITKDVDKYFKTERTTTNSIKIFD